MTEYMTKNEYNNYIQLNKNFERSLVACAQEISQISNGRELIGKFTGDIDLWDIDSTYLVQFETDPCGERDYDSVYVPIEYIYDEGYREYYKKHLVHQREMKAQATLERKANRKVYRVVTDERSEYERLKVKFGDD